MEVLEIIFRLGVVFAIFSFIWGLLTVLFAIVRGGVPLNYPASLTLKALQYFVLVDVVILFCTKDDNLDVYNSVITGSTLLLYFLGKVQNLKFKLAMVQIQGRSLTNAPKPNMRLEFGLVAVAMLFFVFLLNRLDLANNGLANWFYTSILDIEKTVFFGFIFKIIGFFFTITILLRVVNAINVLLTGGNKTRNQGNDQDSDKFDTYEEVE